jgi:hypothetical protein
VFSLRQQPLTLQPWRLILSRVILVWDVRD